jgi:hypothetical protein
MHLIKNIFKASLWGFLLLILLMTIGASIACNFPTHFFNEKDTDKYAKAYNAIIKITNESKKLSISSSYFEKYEIIEKIEKAYNENCINCVSFYGYKLTASTNQFEIDSFLDHISKFTQKENTDKSNLLLFLRYIASFFNVIICFYLIIGLSKFKTLTSIGLIALFLLCTPIILANTAFIFSYDFWKRDFVLNDTLLLTFIFSIGYLFLIYPPIIITYSNKRFSLKKIIKLQGFT